MRLTDEQIMEAYGEAFEKYYGTRSQVLATVRKCLALAAQPDAPSDYADVERRGFEVSQPGELPR